MEELMELTIESLEKKRLEILNKVEGYGIKLAKTLNCGIEINNRMRSAAGRVKYRENKVELNGRLLSKNPEHIEQTFAHELAHLASVELFGRERGSGHGRFWQATMSLFGYPADRCHQLDTEGISRKHKPVALGSCGCRKNIELKKRKFNRYLQGGGYRCSLCKQSIGIVEVLDKGLKRKYDEYKEVLERLLAWKIDEKVNEIKARKTA